MHIFGVQQLEMLSQKMQAFNDVVGVLEDALERHRTQFEQYTRSQENDQTAFDRRLKQQERNMSTKVSLKGTFYMVF